MPRTQAEGAVFVQLGPDEPFRYLTSTGMDDITIPAGDVEVRYVPGPNYGSWQPAGLVQSPPGAVTTTVNFYLESTRAALLNVGCPLNLRLNLACAGPRSDVTNYLSAVVLADARITSRRVSAPVSLEQTSNYIQVSCEISAARAITWGPPTARQLFADPVVAAVAVPETCATECAPGVGRLEVLHVINDGGYFYTTDGGASWNDVELPSGFTPTAIALAGRVLIGGSASSGAAVLYVDGETVSAPVQLAGSSVVGIAQTNDSRVWLATTSRVYVSNNRGASWTAVLNTQTGEQIRDIATDGRFVYAVTSSRLFIGPPFSPVNAPGTTCDVNWGGRVYVVNGGQLYRVYAGEVVNVGVFPIQSPVLRFSADRIFGVAAGPTGVAITEDGGVSWRVLRNVPGGTSVTPADGPSWLVAGENGLYVIEPTEQA